MNKNAENSMLQAVLKIFIGILMITTALWGYIPSPSPAFFAEFTFISNTAGGLLSLTDGILNLRRRNLPRILHLNVGAGLLLVFLICLATLATPNPFNFSGAFFFLHVINPLAYTLSYIFLCKDGADSTFRHLLAGSLFTAGYMVFDYILGNVRGHFVYGFFLPKDLPIWQAALIEIVIILLMLLFGLLLYKLNKKVHNKL